MTLPEGGMELEGANQTSTPVNGQLVQISCALVLVIRVKLRKELFRLN